MSPSPSASNTNPIVRGVSGSRCAGWTDTETCTGCGPLLREQEGATEVGEGGGLGLKLVCARYRFERAAAASR